MGDKKQPKSVDYTVGFAKPPVDRQFKPGVSGNQKGRPKGSKGLRAVLEKAMSESVFIREDGRRKRISKLEAAAKQLTNKAASGDLSAVKVLMVLTSSFEQQKAVEEPLENEIVETDQKVMQSILKRFSKLIDKGNPHDDNA